MDLLSICDTVKTRKKLFDSEKNGKGNGKFHKYCDKYSGTLIIAQSQNGMIARRYTVRFWSNKGPKKSKDTFLFSLDRKKSMKLKIKKMPFFVIQIIILLSEVK